MLNTNTESLLQELATEMAFLEPAQLQGVSHVADGLARLGLEPLVLQLPDAQQALARSLSLCRQAMDKNSGLTAGDLEGLQACFERLSNALYLAAPGQLQEAAPEQTVPAPDSDEDAFVLGPDADLELLNEFCNEGRDLLHQVEQGVLVLEENPRHKETLNQVFRAFHTFKGGAGFLGVTPIQHLAHQLESVLDAARQDQLSITREVIELILAGGDALQQCIHAMDLQLKGEGRGQAIAVPVAALQARAQACLHGQPQVDGAGKGTASMKEETAMAPVQARSADVPAAAPAQNTQLARRGALAQFVKLDTRKLDALVDLMGELVVAQSMVVQHPQVQKLKDRDLERHMRQLSRITTDLQHNAMSLRMVPIRSVMQKMTRLVRDLAATQNKQIQLHLSGEDTELDRKIVEELTDPLLHMMRNAVDHGIELPAARQAQGKTVQGNISLTASHQGGGILICIQDDGKGLDPQKILKKAADRGLLTEGADLSEKDIYNLIFLPGFSTADSVTEISGRGVGMDVVRGSINKLRGRIDIASAPGKGTTFNIFLPLTLAIIDAMLVGLGQERFILPTLAIRESLRPQPGMVLTVQGKGEVIRVRGRLIPLVRLAEKLNLPSTVTDPCDGIVVVVDSGDRPRALLVDSLLGKQEVVIKSLGDAFKDQKAMSGAAILGDGCVALIIDPDVIDQVLSRSPLAA
ncbi:MAG: chemotaxis protein CheA [Limnohabitans sp.]